MAKTIHQPETATRQQILQAALKSFAHRGYAATSVQEIVDAAQVSKPALYYYFADKAALFQALVDAAHDERFRLMEEAAARSQDLRGQLVEILSALFDYSRQNRELIRLSFATALAAPGELPEGLRYSEKCHRNFEFIHGLMNQGLAAGQLNPRFDSRELAYGFHGQMNAYMVAQLLMPDCGLNRQTAERIVELFLTGAALQATVPAAVPFGGN